MKKILWVILFLFPIAVFAQVSDVAMAEVDPVFVPPEWLQSIVMYLIDHFDGVGKIIVLVAQWAGVVASVMTVLAGAAHGIFAIAELGLKNKLSPEQLEKMQKIFDNILYYLKYLSMFNAKKPDPKL